MVLHCFIVSQAATRNSAITATGQSVYTLVGDPFPQVLSDLEKGKPF
jgi:hypothetical protein